MRRVAKQRGFTMIELVLMLVLIPLLAAAFVGVSNFNANNADRLSRRLESDLRYCQQLAMAQETNCGFKTDSTTQYQVYSPVVNTLIIDPYTRQGLQISLAANYQGTAFNAANYQVEFDKRGIPVVGAGSNIVVSMNGTSRTLTVNSAGYVQVQ